MSFSEIDRPTCFIRQLDKLIKKYKRSEEDLQKHINSIAINPIRGDRVPRFQGVHIRKLRIPLKEYKLGKSSGIRVIYMVDITYKWILMVAIYSKKDNNSEKAIQSMIKDNLKLINIDHFK